MTVETVRLPELGAIRTRVSGAQLQPRHLLDQQENTQHLVVRDGDEPVGVLSLFPVDEEGWLTEDHLRLDAMAARDASAAQTLITEALKFIEDHRLGHARTLHASADLHGALADAGFTGSPLTLTLSAHPCECDPKSYCHHRIRVLDGTQAVRLRPAMYLGSTGEAGLQYMLNDLVSNAIDQHLAERLSRLTIELDAEGWTVSDDGPGIPPDALHDLFCRLHFTATRDGHSKHVHLSAFPTGGLAVLNALSQLITVTVDIASGRYQQRFGRGRPLSFPRRLGPPLGQGLTLHIRPDPQIFGTARLIPDKQRAWLQDAAWLNPALAIHFQGRRLDGGDGLPSMVRAMLGDAPVRGLLIVEGEVAEINVRAAIAWTNPALPEKTRAFANQGELTDGGTPMDGLTAGLVGSEARGRVAAVDVLLAHPRFVGPTRGKLDNPEVGEAVKMLVSEALPEFLKKHPDLKR